MLSYAQRRPAADQALSPWTTRLLVATAALLALAWLVVMIGDVRADRYVRSRWVLGVDDADVVGALNVAHDHASVSAPYRCAAAFLSASGLCPLAAAFVVRRRSWAVWIVAVLWLGNTGLLAVGAAVDRFFAG